VRSFTWGSLAQWSSQAGPSGSTTACGAAAEEAAQEDDADAGACAPALFNSYTVCMMACLS